MILLQQALHTIRQNKYYSIQSEGCPLGGSFPNAYFRLSKALEMFSGAYDGVKNTKFTRTLMKSEHGVNAPK